MAPGGTVKCDDTKEKRFLLYVAYALGGTPSSHFATIAAKLGPEYTASSLENKWRRLKADVDKDGGLTGAPSGSASAPTTPKIKGAGRPRKATKAAEDAEGAEDDDATSTPGSKRKSTRVTRSSTPKSKKVKTEGESEEGEKADSKESGEIDEI